MGKLTVFNFISLDGYFEGPQKGDTSWHQHGAEESQYAIESLKSGNTLLFGRVTYELMVSYWPSADAIKNDPVMADGMNNADKIVFSRTLQKVDWNHTRIIKDNIVAEIKRLKQLPGKDITLLGSGSILTQFAEQGLIDEYQLMVDPVVLGAGTAIFNGIQHKLNLKLTSTKVFKSGVVLLCYQPNLARHSHYDTVSNAIAALRVQGFNIDFNLAGDYILNQTTKIHANEFNIVDVYRYEGDSDPADEAAVYAIESNTGLKGILVTSYGAYASDALTTTMLEKLKMKQSH
jgi:dihydrofolate reductase